MRRSLLIVLFALLSVALVATPALAKKKKGKKKKKKGEEAAAVVGPVEIGEWTCWAPPDFAKLNQSQRAEQRDLGYRHVEKLVTGQQVEGFEISDMEDLTFFETAFLGRPQLLDTWLDENFAKCKAVAEGTLSQAEYQSYLSKIGRKLEQGQCYKPLIFEYHNFLDVATDWQFRLHMCKGNKILIESTGEENGKFTVEDKGKYKDNLYILSDGKVVEGGGATPEQIGQFQMAEAGDKGLVADQPLGALLMKFEAEDDSYTKYFVVGLRFEFEAPDNGYISFAVNDSSYYDNKFHDLKGAIDYLSVDIYPPKDEDSVSGGLMP